MKHYKYITDAIYGGISIKDELIFDLYNSREFQRLGRIKHLGVSDFIYPAATHTRLSHSLGVYYLAYKVLENLNPETSLSTRRAILSAALLHDVGHGPLSHNFEKVSKINHELFTVKIIQDQNTEVAKAFSKNDPQAAIETVQIINGEHELDWANKLISSEVDLDRMDYLNRDATFTGTTFGCIDWKFITKNMVLHNEKLVYSQKALPALEEMLLGRFHMNEAIYHNYKNESFAQLTPFFFNRLTELDEEGKLCEEMSSKLRKVNSGDISLEDFQSMDDSYILSLFNKAIFSEDELLSKIARAFLNRKPLKIISGSEAEIKKWASSQERSLKDITWNVFIIKEGWKFYENDPEKEFYIKDFEGNVKPGSEVSLIIKKLGDQKRLYEEPLVGVEVK